MRFTLATALSLTALAHSALAAPPGQAKKHHAVTDFITFGDSYTDNCNTERLETTNATFRQAYPFPKCPPAPEGRASGGKSWVEYLTRLGTTHNYAFSGATCDNALWSRAPVNDVKQQITLARNGFNTTTPVASLAKLYNPETTVAAIYIGTNDLAYFLADLQEEQAYANNAPRHGDFLALGKCVLDRFDELHSLGLRRFVLMENIPLQNTPAYGSSVGGRTFVETFTLANNKVQAYMARDLVAKWNDGSTIDVFPTYDFFESIFAHPQSYGFSNYDPHSYNPEQDYFANSLHPSDKANQILAAKMQRFVLDGARGAALINGTA